MANGWGGARPGAGRKSKETVAYQETRRQQVMDYMTPERWGQVITGAFDDATTGDGVTRARAREWLSAYVTGHEPKETELFGEIQLFGPPSWRPHPLPDPTVIDGEVRALPDGEP